MASLPTSMSQSFEGGSNYLDFPPSELLVKPMPCVVLTGLDPALNPAHKSIADILINDKKSDRLPINYIIRPVDYEYPKAKQKKSSYEWYVPRGILKTHWMRKHLTEVPAVVVIFYNLDWIADPQWREKQGECQSLVRAIQTNLAGRSTKIVLVVIQEGTALPPGGDAISEERCASLCAACGLQLQTSLFILQNNEQLQGCCIKLESRLFELAQNYYVMETRKVKDHREFLNKTTHQLLFVRHHFKTGFLSEFVRPPDGIQAALRNYRQAFGHLMDVRATDYNLHEIKIVAGFISYKIWALSLLPGSNASQRDAELHFRKHVDWLRPRMGQPELAFEHFAWLASQYRMYADLFAEAIRSAGFTASISQHPGVYYHQAAILTRERRLAIMSAPSPQLPKPGTILANGVVVMEGQIPQLTLPNASDAGSNEYFGQRAWRPGYQSLEPPDAVTEAVGIANLQQTERTMVDHSSIVTQLLSSASVHFRKLGSSRMCTRLSWETANELAYTFEKTPPNSAVALSLLKTVVAEYRRDQWTDLLKVALFRQLECPRIGSSGTVDEFDVDHEQELASICFELAAISGDRQHAALAALVAFVTRSQIPNDLEDLFAKSLVKSWNTHIGTAGDGTRQINLDVSVLGNTGGLIQAWSHFPTSGTTLDQIPNVRLYVRRSAESEGGKFGFKVTSVGVHLHFYSYYKAKSTSGTTASMTRATSKVADVEAIEFKSGGKGNQTELKSLDTFKFSCELNKDDANRVVASAASLGGTADFSGEQMAEAFVAISGWWVEVQATDMSTGKSGNLRLNWMIGDEPAPNALPSSQASLSSYPLTSREFAKLRLRNQPPKWISLSTLAAASQSTALLTASPFLCSLKPRQANVVLKVDQGASPALVGEYYPVFIMVKNLSTDAATTEMCLDVSISSSSSAGPRACLLATCDGESNSPSDHLLVKVPPVSPSTELSLKAFIVKQSVPDVMNIALQLRCNSAVTSVDDAIVEVVRHSFSLPVIVPLSLAAANLLDFDTLAASPAYCPYRRNVLSVKLCSSSPHDLELMAMKLQFQELSTALDCAASTPSTSWPRHLRPGPSFVEAFNLPAIETPSFPSNQTAVSLGQVVLSWRRKGSNDLPVVQLSLDLPDYPIQTPAVVVRTARIPPRAVLFKPCAINYQVKNMSRATLSLRASIMPPPAPGNSGSSASMVISGPSDVNITLISGSSMTLPVSFVPLLSGFVNLPRLKISAAPQTVGSSGPTLDPSAQLLVSDITDTLSPNKSIFVQTAPNVEWLLPGSVNPIM